MKKLFKVLFKKILLLFKPILSWLFLKNPERLKNYQKNVKDLTLTGMVSEFNVWHRLIFKSFFRRVQLFASDITKVKTIQGPVVFIMKNRGQLEYRYFNYLFLKEKISPIWYANRCFTLFWWPLKNVWQHMICWLNQFYQNPKRESFDENKYVSSLLGKGKNVLLNLTISRDYFFGLIKTDPIEALMPLIDIQNKLDVPVHVVTLQFLYVKRPDKTERSYFDLLFGEKSQPGAIRKFLLFLMNYRRKPRVKFGAPINLKEFLSKSEQSEAVSAQSLLQKIEEDLTIQQTKITGPKLHSKDALIKEIMANPIFIDRIYTLAKENKKKPENYKKEALRYLQEIAADVNYSYVHFSHITAGHLWNKMYDGVVVKHDQLNKVREIAGKNPMVLVPMHRSHIDYVLISDLFYEHNITFPHVCAGINLNFWPVGMLARKCGGFFIRRTFDGNALYKETLYAYVRSLIAYGHCLEFFIEGTRSRTGKLLKPKMGMLSMIMRAFLEGACKDVYFVPIAVSYDNIIEEKVYEKESSGEEKTKEKTSELLKVRNIFKKKYGKVYIEFADPISLKQYLEKKGIEDQPITHIKKDVSEFAYHLTHHLNKIALVTPVALVSLAILSLNKKTFNVHELKDRINLLKEYLDYKDVNYSDLINFSDQYAYNEAIKKLCDTHILKDVNTFEENFYMFEDKHRAGMDYYKNNILHFFVSLTCFCKILNSVDNFKSIDIPAAIKQYEVLKSLFRHEFTFSERASLEEHLLKVIEYCVQKGFVKFDESKKLVTKTLNNNNYDEFKAYQSLLDNFLESHLIGLRYLRHNRIKNLDAKTLIKEILVKGKPMYLKDDLTHPEALSKFNLENSFKLFDDLGILKSAIKDRGKLLYTSESDSELIEKWIRSIQDLLNLIPPIGQPKTQSTKAEDDVIEVNNLH